MSQIKAKQIKLTNKGDLIVGDSNSNGSVLPVGSSGQSLIVDITTQEVQWQYQKILWDGGENIVIQGLSATGIQNGNLAITPPSDTDPSVKFSIGNTGLTNAGFHFQTVGTGQVTVPSTYVPQTPYSLVTKNYVDTAVTGLDWKNSVRVATTDPSDLTGYTYNPANEPNGNVWTGVTTAPTIDGVTLNDGDRILIKDAPDPRGNGIFVYDATAQAFVRAEDANNVGNNAEVTDGMAVFVTEGTTNAGSGWLLISPTGTANLGTDNLVFTQFNSSIVYAAGSGLSLTGTTFSINDSNTIDVDGSNNVIVKSDNVAGHLLISTGALTEAQWGPLDLSNPNSTTNVLPVDRGGTGLNAVYNSGDILYATSSTNLNRLPIGPASDTNTAYVLQTNSLGNAPVWGTVSLNQLSDVSAPSPVAGDLLRYDGTEWVATNTAEIDQLVRVSNTDTESGYLQDKVDAGNAISLLVSANVSGYQQLVISVNVDGTTTRVNGSNNLAVGEGLINQVLIGQGTGSDAVWTYLDTLYNASGSALLTVTGTGDPLTVTVSPTGTEINTTNDLYLSAQTYLYLQGIRWVTSFPERSVLVANTDNTLSALQATNNADQLLMWQVSTSSFAFVSADSVGGNAFGTIQMIGSWWNGSQFVSALNNSDTLRLEGTRGIFLSAVNANNSIQIGITSSAMPSLTPSGNDLMLFFDYDNFHVPSKTTVDNFIATFGIPTNVVTTSGMLVQLSAGEWATREIVPSVSADRRGISVVNGDGTAGNPEIGLDIESLTETAVVSADDFLVLYRPTTDENVKVQVSSLLTVDSPSNYKWFNISDGTNTATPDTTQDTLTVTGSGITVTVNPATDTVELTLNIPHLTTKSPATESDVYGYQVAIFDTATNTHNKTSLGEAVDVYTTLLYASANATGAANETFANFFATTNVNDDTVVVYFNGIALKKDGWTRTGTSLTLVDAANGYSTEPGDVITAYYRRIL